MMLRGDWVTLEEVMRETGDDSSASVSARIRDLRKERFGGYVVERRRRGDAEAGVHEYRVVSESPRLFGL